VDLKKLVVKIFVEPVALKDQVKFGIAGNLVGDPSYRECVYHEADKRIERVRKIAQKYIGDEFTSIEMSTIL
jgi:hypothetical protein